MRGPAWVLAALDTLLPRPPSDDEVRFFHRECGDRGLRAVNLAESGHLHLQMQVTDLSAEFESVVDFCRHALHTAGQHPVLDLRAGRVQCDPVRIRQAMLALLENVRKYAVPGWILIQTRQDNEWCYLSVEDDGPSRPDL